MAGKSGRSINNVPDNPVKKILMSWEGILVLLLIAVNIFCYFFSSYYSVRSLFGQMPVYLAEVFLMLPMAYILVLGEIDISVGSTVCLSATLACLASNAGLPFPLVFLVSLGVGTLCGVVNATILTLFTELPPMIVTLATQIIFRGIAEVILGSGGSVSVTNTEGFRAIAAKVGLVPYIFFLVLILAVLFAVTLGKTTFGRKVYAIGTNRLTAFDSNTNGSQVFVNQAGTTAVAQALVDAVYDIAGGEGQWAILSATSQSTNQNAWIDAMQEIIAADDTYAGLELVEIAYGDDEAQKSTDQTEALLQNYPDLEVICAPTTVGIAAAAKYLQDSGSSCKLTGLGLPSEMEAYTGDGDDYSCPYFYLWDMEGLGILSAYTTMAMVAGEITGAAGETFTAGDLGEYTIEDNDGVSEIILGEPLEFNPDNVSEYAELY